MTVAASALHLQRGPLAALTDVPGIKVGHYTHPAVARGVTAILCEDGAAAGVSVRGSNPGTLNTDALAPTAVGGLIHGIGLTGGSLFGLGAVAGMTEWLMAHGHGLRLRDALIPITAGAVIYDLDLSDPTVHPTSEWGHRACDAASIGAFARGNVGAGTGGTAGKGHGCVRTKGGLGTASLLLPGEIVVAGIVVINSMGGLIHPVTGEYFAVSGGFDTPLLYRLADEERSASASITNTTIGVIATNADLSDPALTKVADLAHDGLARAIRPMHTMLDGDTIFTIAPRMDRVQLPGTTGSNLTDLVGAAAADVMVLAVLDAAEQTAGFGDWPSAADARELLHRRAGA